MVTLENIGQHTIPFDKFRYKWRFTEEKHSLLPAHHLEQIRPLDKPASQLLIDITARGEMFGEQELSKSYFRDVQAIQIPEASEGEQIIKKWLYRRGLSFEQQVFASWDNTSAAITTWKMIVKYWSDFWYPVSDDLVVIDNSLRWALVFYHWDYIEFGTNEPRTSEICENELSGTGNS